MKKILLISVVVLSACAQAGPNRTQVLTCQSRGFEVNTPEYNDCISSLMNYQITEEKDRNNKAFMDAAEIWKSTRTPQPQMQPAPQIQQPIYCQRNGTWQVVCR